ncbi:FAD/NAD(P)-binding domain-containing protein [Westerdykella ornata]|uniref:FAD/NAD(P)-binding domain-containing protein n=1 Tax=Westerdykella ornata TaxID=318751 RepID=A0A6A6JQR3_WESOR|nr:FAD/NAD(P)-binding domain-containing protein [Westerdykella ornata]KAF2278036.1 FAD/NAD(P)-binding domain-containing protein [Westerdykella ornata]
MRLQGVPVSDSLQVNRALDALADFSFSSPHRVLIVGCAYGGISALVNLLDLAQGKPRDTVYPVPSFTGRKSRNGLEITVIDERDGYFHAVGAPLAHVTPKHTASMWKRYARIKELRHPNLTFKHGTVKRIDPASKVAEWVDRRGELQKQSYDYVVVATGLRRQWPAVPKSNSYNEFLRDGRALVDQITGGDPAQKDRKVVVIGAGAVGVEFAGEIKNHYPGISVTLVHSRSEVLSSEPLPSEVKEKVKTLLEEEGVQVILGNRAQVKQLPNGKSEVTLSNGDTLVVDAVLDATKKGSATTDFLPAECLNDDKEIQITSNLQFRAAVPNAESHFAVGDVVEWSGIKRAGGAMVMGQLAACNLYASILNTEDPTNDFALAELPEYQNVIGIAVGKQCLTYDKQNGMKWGVQLMKDYFQDDLGWAANLRYLRLTDVEDETAKPIAKAQITQINPEAVPTAA